MFDPANIKINRHQRSSLLRIEWSTLAMKSREVILRLILGIRKAEKVPRRIDKCIHRIRLSLRWSLTTMLLDEMD